jgi:hypothetical protein
MSQITGRDLKEGDNVRAARGSPHPDGRDRELADMPGIVVEVLPHANSGARKAGQPPRGKVKVLWLSGSVGTHDSHMIVRMD